MNSNKRAHLYKIFLVITLLLSPGFLWAQQSRVDSLSKLIRQHVANDSVKVDLYYELANTYRFLYPDTMVPVAMHGLKIAEQAGFERGRADCMKMLAIAYVFFNADYNKALMYDSLALDIYDKMGNIRGMGAIYNNIAIINNNQSKYRNAIAFYNRSLLYRELAGDSAGIADCYNNIGNTYINMANYADALINLLRALKLREQMNNRRSIVNSLNNIAGVYGSIGKYDKALSFSLKALKICEEDNDLTGCIWSYSDVALAYYYKKEYDQSLRYYFKGLNLALKNGFRLDVRSCEAGIAEVYVATHEHEKAFEYYNKALAIHGESDYLEEDISIYIGMGKAYVQMGKTRQGIEHLLKGLRMAMPINYKIAIEEASRQLSVAYALLQNYHDAYHYSSLNAAYKDSMLNDETNKKVAESQFNYELDKKETAISLLEKDKSIQQAETESQKLISMGLLLFLLLILIILVNAVISVKKERKAKALIMQQKDEIEQQRIALEKLNQLKDKTFSILSHDLRAPVGSLTQLLGLLDDNSLTHDEFIHLKKDLDKQLSSLGLLLNNLLNWSRTQMDGNTELRISAFNPAEVIDQNIGLLHENSSAKNISVTNLVPADATLSADKNMIDLVIRNLISNAIKFTNPGGAIQLSWTVASGISTLIVADNGTGMSAEQQRNLFEVGKRESSYGTRGEKGTGLGLLLCKEFVELHKGSISVQSEEGKGTTFFISLPAAGIS